MTSDQKREIEKELNEAYTVFRGALIRAYPLSTGGSVMVDIYSYPQLELLKTFEVSGEPTVLYTAREI